MFTGIVEATGKVIALKKLEGNLHITIEALFTNKLKVDQSIAHNGVCLTVVDMKEKEYIVTAIQETLDKSNLWLLKIGDEINLERSMMMNGRMDGHIVQGHVDQTAVCTSVKILDGSWLYTFEYDSSSGNITVEKGSVSVNGVSLTVVNSQKNSFSVAIIPYTFEHTNFHTFKSGTVVNLEFDILGKYITKYLNLRGSH